MALINLKTVTKTALVASFKLTAPADRIGLGFDAGQAYPTDILSPGHFSVPNPVPEPGSRQDEFAEQMRKQMRPGMSDVVPPAGSAGCLRHPGSSAVGVTWRVSVTDPSRNRFLKARVVNLRLGRDCQSPDRSDDNTTSLRTEASPAAAAAK
jgi:hypothetical protein